MTSDYLSWRFKLNEALKKCSKEDLLQYCNELLDMMGDKRYPALQDEEIEELMKENDLSAEEIEAKKQEIKNILEGKKENE
ncbi:hypothetical protein [Rhodococcus opacus]|nr:hypothetical protein [Rhodococcus opacus]